MTGCSDLLYLWHLNLPYRPHDIPQVAGFKVQGEKERYSYSIVLEFKSNKIIAMHILQKLVYISGNNDAYLIISNVACAWESWLPATIYFMSIAFLVDEVFNHHSNMWKHCNNFVAHCTLWYRPIAISSYRCILHWHVPSWTVQHFSMFLTLIFYSLWPQQTHRYGSWKCYPSSLLLWANSHLMHFNFSRITYTLWSRQPSSCQSQVRDSCYWWWWLIAVSSIDVPKGS